MAAQKKEQAEACSLLIPLFHHLILFFHKNIFKCFYHGVSHRAAFGGEDSMEQHFQRLCRLRRRMRHNKTILSFYWKLVSKVSAIWPNRAPKPSAASRGYSYSTAYIWLPEG